MFNIKSVFIDIGIYPFRNFIHNKDTTYYFLINRVFHSHFHLNGNIYKLNFLPQKNKIIVDETFISDGVLNKDFDVVVDLNDKFNYDLALLINDTKSIYKVGFKKEYSDLFYNLQFEMSANNILEDSYNKIKLMLS